MQPSGHIHPLTWTIRESVEILRQLGFSVAMAQELEIAEYNFDRLNFPEHHPARDMQDTLWVDEPTDAAGSARLMRTHTSNTQIRAMERDGVQPPVRFVVPGRVFRNEAPDATHAIDFYQLEGFAIDRGIALTDLLGTLEMFAKKFFGSDTLVRFRPSFFPFTEPSVEMSIFYDGRWLELVGAGMIHPNVIAQMGNNKRLDPNNWSGFAFGFGIDRLMMVRYGLSDIRLAYGGDYRFLKQFPGSPIKE